MKKRVCTCDNTGKGGVSYQSGWCYGCWLVWNRPAYARRYGMPEPANTPPTAVPVPLQVDVLPRSSKCISLGVRIENKPGCAGMLCRWSCEKGLPAMPAGHCQTCDAYEPDGDAGWLS